MRALASTLGHWLCAALSLAILSGIVSCGPSVYPIDETLQLIDPDAHATAPMVRLPVAGNPVFFATDIPASEWAQHLHRIDAWCQAYPIPGVRVYVFTFHGSPHSYRTHTTDGADAVIRLGRWQENGQWIVGDCSWEIPRLYYGADDPPPLGIGPVNLPPEDAARRARALALAGAP